MQHKKTFHKEAENPENTPKNATDRGVISWIAPEFVYHKRGRMWYLVSSTITLLLVIYGILTDSPTMAIAFLMLYGVYFLVHNKKPKQINIIISELGIKADKKFYPFSIIKGFYILYNPPYLSELRIETTAKIMSQITLQLADIDPVPVRSYLVKQIPEIEGKEESFLDTLTRVLKL